MKVSRVQNNVGPQFLLLHGPEKINTETFFFIYIFFCVPQRMSKWWQNVNFSIFGPCLCTFDSPSVFYQCSWPHCTLDERLWCHKACRHCHGEWRRAMWYWVILSQYELLLPSAAFRMRRAALRDNLADLCHIPPPNRQVEIM